MRRALLVLAGFSAGCALLWSLCAGAAEALRQPEQTVQASEPAAEAIATVPAESTGIAQGPKPVNICLPYAIEGTTLVAEYLASYEGQFLEDGSNRPVADVAALLLRNIGSCGIRYARVVLERGGLQLVFEATAIPPGEAVLVLEKNGLVCPEHNFSACYGSADGTEAFGQTEGQIEIGEAGMGSLTVTNRTEQAMESVRIFYKTYDPASGIYVGGITYTIQLENLAPGETRQLFPNSYASGFSRVVMVCARSEDGRTSTTFPGK